MKPYSVLACAVVTSVLVPPPQVFAAEPVNLIVNGGFEQGVTGWMPDPAHALLTEAGRGGFRPGMSVAAKSPRPTRT